jgi:hypothetical protein
MKLLMLIILCLVPSVAFASSSIITIISQSFAVFLVILFGVPFVIALVVRVYFELFRGGKK